VGAIGTLTPHALQASNQFTDTHAYAATVLDARPPRTQPPQHVSTSAESVLWALIATAGAVGLGAFGLWRRRLPSALRERAGRALVPALNGLRTLHSGHVGDYVAWLTMGTAVLGGLVALGLS
jgi:multicomponent Na+:H+ antiporter subunit D